MFNVEIIHQEKDFLVLNKPAGISVHGDGKREEYTLTDWLLENFPQIEGVGEDLGEIKKPGIVHRLDKETSGVILVALNQDAYEFFKKQFKDREVKKVYNAFAYGNIKNDIFTVDKPIGKDRKDFRRRTTKNPRGKTREAVTDFKIIERGKDKDELFIFVEARPKTGRMHQIRVHLKDLNTPIVCDRLYAPKKRGILGFERLALHAKKIEFKRLNGEDLEFEAEYPKDFKKALDKTI